MKRSEAHSILETNESMNLDQIKAAFKKKAAKNHPDVDKTPGAESRFKKINEAFSVLKEKVEVNNINFNVSNPFNAHYSHTGFNNPFNWDGYMGFNGQYSDFWNKANFDFDEHFKGESLNFNLNVSLKDYVNNTPQKVVYNRKVKCSRCRGFYQRTRCICTKGFYLQEVSYTISISNKLENNLVLRIAGGGDIDDRQHDSFFTLKIIPEDGVIINGNNIYKKIPVSFTQYVVGGEIEFDFASQKHSCTLTKNLSHKEFVIQTNIDGIAGNKVNLVVDVLPMTDDEFEKVKKSLTKKKTRRRGVLVPGA